MLLSRSGEARGYSTLALAAKVFSESRYFKDPVFSGLSLNDKGGVKFSLETKISPELLSYVPAETGQTPGASQELDITESDLELPEEFNLLEE